MALEMLETWPDGVLTLLHDWLEIQPGKLATNIEAARYRACASRSTKSIKEIDPFCAFCAFCG
jgi:hypothetical protein